MIDSWTWIEYWRVGEHSEAAARYIEGEEQAVLSAINLAEVYHWVLQFYDQKTAEQKRMTIEKRCFIIPVDRAVAIEAAKIKRSLGLALADSLILATAKLSGAWVVTGDDDFRTLKDAIFIGG